MSSPAAAVIRFPNSFFPSSAQWDSDWRVFMDAVIRLPPDVLRAGVRCGVLPPFVVARALRDADLARDFHCEDMILKLADPTTSNGGDAA